ncbi:MAG TPA: sigma-70 family RNA polymerase sigma factor [Marinobacter sp.]|uniref:Uncharacterized protein n=1 Tax=marine sediment metagenome TaxID=412755 RepID=A0A0F9RK37_9ZZZZ|nr:sigma-70 family RNA polymerase sigma factor [Marinobacter sp.]
MIGSASEAPSAADVSSLIGRVAKQDRTAFAKLYEATAPKLLGVVLRIMKDRPWADEVVQEVYLKIWQRAGLFNADIASPITWLVSIARNQAIDELRKNPAGRTTTDDAMDERTAQQPTVQDQMENQQPSFLLTVDLQNRQLKIRPVTAEPQPGKSYQLWIKADELGPNPRSVGVLGDRMQVDQGALKQYDPALLREATFGISLEPPGGSPTGQPTGPAIHGTLYPAGDNSSYPADDDSSHRI